MALVKCKECGKEISDTIKKCPHCGYKEKKKISKKNLITIVIAAVVAVIVIIGLVIGLNIGKAKKVENYEKKLVETGGKIYVNGIVSQIFCYDISKVWYNTIFEVSDSKYDEYTHYKTSYSNARYWNSDFNDSIQSYLKAKSKGLSSLKETKDELSKDVKDLKNIPSDKYKDTYDALVDFYGVFAKLVDSATSPSGSLSEYSKNYNSYSNDFEESYNKLKVLLPEIEKYNDKKASK